ncbi:MAG: hypothetical protein KBG28_13045 [Kofleriaceae bacterium]|jgi:hypothetical protein|nr:hypothetical protein [Kofleriaceae bacterium]MBP9204890.1 hypothetical protein [Kofleriaceae bacterium]
MSISSSLSLSTLAAVAILAGTTTAAAAKPASSYGFELGSHAGDLEILSGNDPDRIGRMPDVAACRTLAAEAKAELPADTMLDAYNFTLLPGGTRHLRVDHAGRVCDALAAAVPALSAWRRAIDTLAPIASRVDTLRQVAPGEWAPEALAALAELPATCRAEVARARAAGIPTTQKLTHHLTLAQAEADTCGWLEANVASYRKASGEQRAAVEESYRAPFRAAGARGERLELLAKYSGLAWRLPGGRTTEDTHVLARARVLYQWLEADDPHPRYVIHTVRRYQLAGDKVVKVSEQSVRGLRGSVPTRLFK